jgi:hypothetical protein
MDQREECEASADDVVCSKGSGSWETIGGMSRGGHRDDKARELMRVSPS